MNAADDRVLKQVLENLERFRDFERRVLADPTGHPRLRELELAGIRKMISQLHAQLRSRRWELLHDRVAQLREQLRGGQQDIAQILDSTLHELEEVSELAGSA